MLNWTRAFDRTSLQFNTKRSRVAPWILDHRWPLKIRKGEIYSASILNKLNKRRTTIKIGLIDCVKIGLEMTLPNPHNANHHQIPVQSHISIQCIRKYILLNEQSDGWMVCSSKRPHRVRLRIWWRSHVSTEFQSYNHPTIL